MKREFLQNLKVGELPLPKDVIDAILDEYGRDIAKAKADAAKPYEDYEALKEQLAKIRQEHKQELDELRFQTALETAVGKARGRNIKAVAALLDMESLRQSEDPQQALEKALAELKQEHGYLFLQDVPPFAAGTGTVSHANTQPATLAGALKEKFERK